MEKLTGKEILKLITEQQALVASYEHSVKVSKSQRLNTLAFAEEQLELAQEGLRKMEEQVFAFADVEPVCCAPSISMSGPGESMSIASSSENHISDGELMYRLTDILKAGKDVLHVSVVNEINAQLLTILLRTSPKAGASHE